MSRTINPVLIIGGSGVVGSWTARTIRKLHPGLPLAIGGRDLEKAEAVAREIGGATGIKVDLDRPDLGLSGGEAFSAVAVFVKDDRLSSMRYAQHHRIPYISISSGTFEIGPEVAQYIHAPDRAPILLASHWLAGAAIFPVLAFAKDFQRIDAIRIGVLLDEQDMGGPAALADYNRITGAAPAALTVKDGRMHWAGGDEGRHGMSVSMASNWRRRPIRHSTSWRWLAAPMPRQSGSISPIAFPPAVAVANRSRRKSPSRSRGRGKMASTGWTGTNWFIRKGRHR